HILRAANAGVRLQGNAAKQAQDPMAAVSSEVKPDGVRDQAGEHGDPKPEEEAELPGRGKGARRQQQGHDRQRQPHLLQEYGHEHDRRAVVDEELSGISHAAKSPPMVRLARVTKANLPESALVWFDIIAS